jgi:trk system potassium uptake protein
VNVLIAGAGRLGTQIAQVLCAARNEVTLIDTDDDRLAELEGRVPVRLVAGDACEPALL